jgi:hypothetical protein
MGVFQVLGTLLFFALCLCGFVCGGIAFVNNFRAIANRKERRRGFFGRYPSLLTVIFDADEFTQRGLAARRWVIVGLIGFFVFGLLAVTVGITTGVAH